jgi:hypothetical protein
MPILNVHLGYIRGDASDSLGLTVDVQITSEPAQASTAPVPVRGVA